LLREVCSGDAVARRERLVRGRGLERGEETLVDLLDALADRSLAVDQYGDDRLHDFDQ
jgi:hypothetical protein